MLLSYMPCYSQKTEEDVCLSNIMKMNSDIQQGKVNTRHIKVFLDCFIDHTNNVEILEFRNIVLFKLMEYCPEEFICLMSKKNTDILSNVCQNIENPIHDNINLYKIYNQILITSSDSDVKTEILDSLKEAIAKNNSK